MNRLQKPNIEKAQNNQNENKILSNKDQSITSKSNLRNVLMVGHPNSNCRARSISASMDTTSCLVNVLSVMYTKSSTLGGLISSYFLLFSNAKELLKLFYTTPNSLKKKE